MNHQNVQIGWLDLSDAEQRRAREYLRQFRTEGTIDELGFGIIRDALADVFFPATSTIMTRTRYLIFVAAAFMRIERERLSGGYSAKKLKQLEDGVRKILTREVATETEKDEMRGVIGATSKEDLQRYPSIIYWSALKRLGIFQRTQWGLTYYLDHLTDYYAAITPKQDDDGLSHLALGTMHNWDPKLEEILSESPGISQELEFLPELDFHLSSSEARYLRDRFNAFGDSNGTSLMAHLLNKSFGAVFSYPWEVPCPDELSPLVKQAQTFSMLAKGATLQYYDLLLQEQKARGMKINVENFERPFTKWFELTRSHLSSWDIGAFIILLEGKCRLRPSDKVFLREWLKLCQDAGDGKSFLTDVRARESVRRREKTVRPLKHRLGQEKYLRQWPSPASLDGWWYADSNHLPYLLDYRSNIGGVFVREIVAGLKEKS